jgi:alcohol dehydrogenase
MIPPLIADMARTHGLPPLKRAVGWMTRLLPIPQPTMFTGAGASARLGQAIGDFHHQRVMVVTDASVAQLGLLEPLLGALGEAGVATTVFDRVTPDAPIALIDEGVVHYRREGCDALVAVGGGSVMDAAKVIGLCVTNGKPPRALAGYFRGLHAPATAVCRAHHGRYGLGSHRGRGDLRPRRRAASMWWPIPASCREWPRSIRC